MTIADDASILSVSGLAPRVPETAFVAAGARLVGDVTLGEGASVWYNAVARGDSAAITLGAIAGQYSIRKKPFEEALSTLEAGYHLLSRWEGEPVRFAPLMTLFTHLNRQWHDFAQGRRR